jgi:hypothetical protein
MRRQCQFTVKRSEKRVDLTVAAEQQLCVVQVVERVGLVTGLSVPYPSCRRVCGGGIGSFFRKKRHNQGVSDPNNAPP